MIKSHSMTLHKNMLVMTTTMMIFFLINPLLLSLASPFESFDEFYSEERDALLKLRDSVSSHSWNLHSNWTGPPCININSSKWYGISCSNWRVVHLVLEGIQLEATIAAGTSLPPTFLHNITFLSKLSFRNNTFSGHLPNLSNLVHMQYVDFSYNQFSGSIPLEYTGLPKLQVLELQDNYLVEQIPPFDQSTLRAFNVSHNDLEGSIPKTDVLQKFPKSSYDDNARLCGSPLGKSCSSPLAPSPSPSPDNSKIPKALIVALIVAASVPFFVIFLFLCYYRKVHEKDHPTSIDQPEQTGSSGRAITHTKMALDEKSGDPENRVELEFFDKEMPAAAFFDLDDLLRASAEVLRKGKLGTSYKVTLESGPVVVVKRLKYMNELSKKEFTQQMQLLGKMRHENLVHILSFYFSKEEKLVIYKFVPGATTLFELLHENRGVGRVSLSWATRLSIIKDIAKGLTFLHQSLHSQKVPHANLKSSNVLVVLQHNSSRENYQVKLTDFGFLPLLPARNCSENGILVIAKSPELAQGKKLSQKADVYSFGIVLLEVITGRIPGKVSPGSDETIDDDLSDWVRMVVNNDWSTEILDEEILEAKDDHDDMLKLTNIALQCTDISPERRPKMIQVLKSIQGIEID